METIYANPVGIIKKDIYIIKNDINHMVYIGQSVNVKNRFRQHCKPCNMNNSLIGKAIKKYGVKHFWIEVLERQVENYNDREKYWINYFNSIVPNGYNVSIGGEEPPTYYGDDHPQCKLSDVDVKNLKYDLANTDFSLSSLEKKYHISKRQVMRINLGISRANLWEKYPIRYKPNINGKLTKEDVDMIIHLLSHTYQFNGDIARMFGVDVHAISKINSGQSHKRTNIEYPIRDWKSSGVILFTYEQVTEIIELLKNSNLSLNKIAKKYNVYVQSIQQINNGSAKKYRRKEIIYPIRNF